MDQLRDLGAEIISSWNGMLLEGQRLLAQVTPAAALAAAVLGLIGLYVVYCLGCLLWALLRDPYKAHPSTRVRPLEERWADAQAKIGQVEQAIAVQGAVHAASAADYLQWAQRHAQDVEAGGGPCAATEASVDSAHYNARMAEYALALPA